jgi:hypothetical protein
MWSPLNINDPSQYISCSEFGAPLCTSVVKLLNFRRKLYSTPDKSHYRKLEIHIDGNGERGRAEAISPSKVFPLFLSLAEAAKSRHDAVPTGAAVP